jgi:hypothetical protein
VGLKAKPYKGCSISDVPNNTSNTNCGQLKTAIFTVRGISDRRRASRAGTRCSECMPTGVIRCVNPVQYA